MTIHLTFKEIEIVIKNKEYFYTIITRLLVVEANLSIIIKKSVNS